MTDEQREDLMIEWSITSTLVKKQIVDLYYQHFGENQTADHWEHFLVDTLNLQQSWTYRGLF